MIVKCRLNNGLCSTHHCYDLAVRKWRRAAEKKGLAARQKPGDARGEK